MPATIDVKRRTCLTLGAMVEHAARAGVRTLTPETLTAWLAGVLEHKAPEAICAPPALALFHRSCTKAELTLLLEEYQRLSLVDLTASATRVLQQRLQDRPLEAST